MARRNKPFDPAQQARVALERRRQDFEAVCLDPGSATLPAFADVEIQRQGQKSDRNRAWRSNVFRLLLERKSITTSQHEAAYLLIADWAAWKGLDGGPDRSSEFVDGGAGCAELVSDPMIKAGERIYGSERYAGALRGLDPQSRAILEAFMVATVEEDRPMSWRGILERLGIDQGTVMIAGQRRDKQVQAVVVALELLRVHYQEPGRVAA